MPGVDDDSRYYASTAVFISEVMKLTFCSLYAISEQGFVEPFKQVFQKDWWKLAIPALLYTLQNNLQYVAVSNLDAVTFQVMHQLKILSTALFSVILLRRSLSKGQWAALVLLTFGVALIQLPEYVFANIKDLIFKNGETDFKRQVSETESPSNHIASSNPFVGLMAILTASTISGLSGVYFEKVLKNSISVSIWVRNIQLSIFSLIPCLVFGVYLKDGHGISKNGFLYGYNMVVWVSVTLQAMGGIVVSLSVKYADNIAKNFATSISIILSFLISVLFFGFAVSINFVFGVLAVLTATYIFSHQGNVISPRNNEYEKLEEV